MAIDLEEPVNRKKPSSDIFDNIDDGKEAKRGLKVPKPKEAVERDNQLERAIDLMKAIKVYRK